MTEIKKKPTILVCTDSPVVSTGFGRVCNNLITRWLNTGKYRIVVMGTNDRAEYHPMRGAHPDLIIEPLPYIGEDPYGLHKMPEILEKYQPDLIFSLNDIWVWTGDDRHPQMLNWFYKHIKKQKPYIPWIGYFPVDGRPWERRWVDLVNTMTYAVSFCDYAGKVLKETPGVDQEKVKVIYHGHDAENFYPCEQEEKDKMRENMGIPKDAYLIGVINRNQPRKNIPAVIQSFKMLRDGYVICGGTFEDGSPCRYPRNQDVTYDCELCGSTEASETVEGIKNAYLYLHMNPLDARGYRLPKVQLDNKAENIITIQNHDVSKGVSIKDLNAIYNCCDVIVNPTTAGGYELTTAEAMSAGTPVVATRTTSIIEQLQDGRGYLVPACTYMVLDDASHCFKHIIDVRKLTETLRHIHFNPEEAKARAEKALPFAKERSWDKAAKDFEELIDKALATREMLHEKVVSKKQNMIFANDTNNFGELISMLPSLRSLMNQHEEKVKFAIAVKREFKDLINMKNIDVFDIDRIWIDRQELEKGQYTVQMTPVHQVPENMLQASATLGAAQEQLPSAIEAFANSLRAAVNQKDVYTSFKFDPKELIEAKNRLAGLEDKMKVLVLNHCLDSKNSFNSKTLQGLNTLLSKAKECVVLTINADEIECGIPFNELSIRETLALIKQCDCVITNSESYSHFANFTNVPYITIQGTKLLAPTIKHSLARKATGEPLSCIIGTAVNPNENHLNISPGGIFSKFLTLKDYWVKNNAAKEIATDSIVVEIPQTTNVISPEFTNSIVNEIVNESATKKKKTKIST